MVIVKENNVVAELRTYATPASLYRYRPLGTETEQEVEAIERGYIFCPMFDSMNDPMEGTHRLSLRILTGGTGSTVQEEVRAAQHRMGIASLSEVSDHEPMWAHYAGAFSGMCIQYNTRALLRGLPDDVDLARMMYSEKPPLVLEDRQSPEDRAKLTLSTKTVRWANEREWRFFRPVAGPAHYSEPRTITRIYLGARIADADEETVRLAARRHGINVVKMKIDAYTIGFTSAHKLSSATRKALGWSEEGTI